MLFKSFLKTWTENILSSLKCSQKYSTTISIFCFIFVEQVPFAFNFPSIQKWSSLSTHTKGGGAGGAQSGDFEWESIEFKKLGHQYKNIEKDPSVYRGQNVDISYHKIRLFCRAYFSKTTKLFQLPPPSSMLPRSMLPATYQKRKKEERIATFD